MAQKAPLPLLRLYPHHSNPAPHNSIPDLLVDGSMQSVLCISSQFTWCLPLSGMVPVTHGSTAAVGWTAVLFRDFSFTSPGIQD